MMEEQEYIIEQLDKHNKANFSCGNDELNNYLKTKASQDIKKICLSLMLYQKKEVMLFVVITQFQR